MSVGIESWKDETLRVMTLSVNPKVFLNKLFQVDGGRVAGHAARGTPPARLSAPVCTS
jgi:hypothetical protein